MLLDLRKLMEEMPHESVILETSGIPVKLAYIIAYHMINYPNSACLHLFESEITGKYQMVAVRGSSPVPLPGQVEIHLP